MRILLPPSETKSPGGEGPRLKLARLGFTELNATRAHLLGELEDLATDVPASRAALGLSTRQDAEIARNARVRRSPTMPAVERYAGVLFDALDVGGLTPAARRRANDSLVICSALFGALRPSDPIPAYRLSGGSRIPNVGALAALWRPTLTEALATDNGVVVDLRSAAYATLAPLPHAIMVRVVDDRGRAVSHHNKAAKGLFARALVSSRRTVRRVDDLIGIAETAGFAPERSGQQRIDIRLPE